ncbi:histidine kinase [Altererythrobacter sp. B11]|uniref:sensor histidine kinase n=1 Tax=Altererythrobacter sp. B11 TaxID=2060312 RepID=UPI000DC73FEE|nr:histidine kinase [Altererythrobacter sp. B11]BBC71477.1 histidine kinase [Altererythrobacter sp. B11]
MNSTRPEDPVVRVPFKTVLASIVGLWLCYFALTTLRGQLLDLGLERELLWRRSLACLAGMVITLGLWLVLRLFDAKPLWAKITAALILSAPVALLIAQANQMLFASLSDHYLQQKVAEQGYSLRRSENGEILIDIPGFTVAGAPANSHASLPASALLGTAQQQVAEIAFGRYSLLLAWCALYLALLTGEKARAAERREGAYRRAAKAAELRSLRYQVNPHFLFNTLNSLSALVLTGKTQAAERMIQTISTFYRRSLADDPTSDVPLSEEFALQKLYLDIEAVRFPRRLQAEYDLPDGLEDAKVPGMILQPLVENSVKHAVNPTSGKVTITLAAREEYGRLVVTVADDGKGDGGAATRQGYGIGLANVRERLEARFGEHASVVSGRTEEGYSTTLRMPIARQREDKA